MSYYRYCNYYRFVDVIGFNENQFVNYEQKRILKRSNHMDFTILAVVLLLCGGIPLRNKIYKERKKKKEDKKKGI